MQRQLNKNIGIASLVMGLTLSTTVIAKNLLCVRVDGTGANDAIAENINSQIQAAIVRARGFQSLRSLTNIIFLTTGKLTDLPANPFLNPTPA